MWVDLTVVTRSKETRSPAAKNARQSKPRICASPGPRAAASADDCDCSASIVASSRLPSSDVPRRQKCCPVLLRRCSTVRAGHHLAPRGRWASFRGSAVAADNCKRLNEDARELSTSFQRLQHDTVSLGELEEQRNLFEERSERHHQPRNSPRIARTGIPKALPPSDRCFPTSTARDDTSAFEIGV